MQLNVDSIISFLDTIRLGDESIIKQRIVRDLEIKENKIHFNLIIPGRFSAQKDEFYRDLYDQLNTAFPDVEIHAHFINQAAFSEAANTQAPQIKNFIAIASGKGGVGKSTVSSNLAINLAKLGYKVGILDADLYGPSIPTMFGIKDQRPKVIDHAGKQKLVPIQVQNIHIISLGNIIDPEQAVVLRGPRLAAIIKQFFNDTVWPDLDYLVIDLPPGTGDIQLTLVQTIPITGVVLVTTPQEVAFIDAVKAANMFTMDSIAVPILGVIENMSWFETEDVPGKKYFIFGSGGGRRLSDYSDSLLLGQIPIVETIRQRSDNELSIFDRDASSEIYAEITGKLVQRVDLRNLTLSPTKKVEMQQ